jgi:multidrug efflux pump
MLVVPLGIVGSVAAAYLRGHAERRLLQGRADHHHRSVSQERDPDHRVRQGPRGAQGKPLIAAALEACELRFRPIVMTSLAFILGVVPLVIANGASAKSQQALGTGVLGGMITATVLAVFMVPIFFVVVMRFLSRGQRTSKPELADAA